MSVSSSVSRDAVKRHGREGSNRASSRRTDAPAHHAAGSSPKGSPSVGSRASHRPLFRGAGWLTMAGMNDTWNRAQAHGLSRSDLLDAILQRAADRLGDLRPGVMARFYPRFPEARALFETESAGHREKLEGEMVEQTLYCLMTWVERPAEVRIVLQSTVPHHEAALHVSDRLFAGFLDAVVETIGATIPAEATDEQALLAAIHAALHHETLGAAAIMGHGFPPPPGPDGQEKRT
jgi:hypothetical protein